MASRGRPTVEPTDAERKQILDLISEKTPVSDIAKLVGHSPPWVRKYFSKELISQNKSEMPAGVKVTPALREKVARYIGCRMSPEQVAKAIGITVPQLESNFPDEISTGQAKARAKVIDALHDQMDEGNVGATKTLEALTSVPDGPPPPAGAQGGKKVSALHTAQAAAAGGGKFAPPPGPRLAVNNDAK